MEITSSEEEGFRELASFLETKLNSTILKDIVDLVNKTQSRCPGIEDKLKVSCIQITLPKHCLPTVRFPSPSKIQENYFYIIFSKLIQKFKNALML